MPEKLHRFFTYLATVTLCLVCLHTQALADDVRTIKVQWPIDWAKPEVRIDNSLYQRVSNRAQPVDTLIPDSRYARLLPVSYFLLIPQIHSALYASEDKVIMVNYSPGGHYLAHRILAVAAPQATGILTDEPIRSHIYSHILTDAAPSIVFYEDGNIYGGYTPTVTIPILPDGQFGEASPDETLNTTDSIAFFACSSNGLNGIYALHEQWLLIDPFTQNARKAATVGYWSNFLGDSITLTRDIFDAPYAKYNGSAVLAFKGDFDPENVRFLPMSEISEAEFNRLAQPINQSRALYNLRLSFNLLVHNANEQQASGTVLPINEQMWLAALSLNEFNTSSVLIGLDAHGQPAALLSPPNDYNGQYLFEVDGQLYILSILLGEGSTYTLFEVHERQIHLKAFIGFACC